MGQGVYGEPCVTRHSAWIADRGGKNRIAQLVDISNVQWDRRRDDVSEAVISIRGAACSAQAATLSNIEPKRSELILYRDDVRVWEGPINRVGWHQDWVEIAAKDVMDYVFGRPLSKQWDNSYATGVTEVTTRIDNIMQYEMKQPFSYLTADGTTVSVPGWEQLDPPANVLPYFTVHHSPNEARTSSNTKPFAMTVGEHIDNLARVAGVDYTVIGRAIHVWDVSRSLGKTRIMTEADFLGEVIVTAYGSDLATIGFAVSQDGRAGGAGQNSDYYGPWTKMFTVYDEDETNPPSQADLNSQAARNISGRSPVPIEVRVPDNSGIRLGPGISMDTLVPGVEIPLLARLNARQVSQLQKLHRLTVNETPDGESIQVSLLPSTKPDDDDTGDAE